MYSSYYASPLGDILIICDDKGLTQLSFARDKYFPPLPELKNAPEHPIIKRTKQWLSFYFAGIKPGFLPPLHANGSAFQELVWSLLLQIPYGETTTYGSLAREVARLQARARMSAQAIGGAVGRNPIGIIVPCHRVIGKSGNLTGYAGGIDKKLALLKLEGVDTKALYLQKQRKN